MRVGHIVRGTEAAQVGELKTVLFSDRRPFSTGTTIVRQRKSIFPCWKSKTEGPPKRPPRGSSALTGAARRGIEGGVPRRPRTADFQRCLKVGGRIQGRFNVLATNDLGEPTNATPAISDRQIFLRTDGHLYCIAEN